MSNKQDLNKRLIFCFIKSVYHKCARGGAHRSYQDIFSNRNSPLVLPRLLLRLFLLHHKHLLMQSAHQVTQLWRHELRLALQQRHMLQQQRRVKWQLHHSAKEPANEAMQHSHVCPEHFQTLLIPYGAREPGRRNLVQMESL